MKNTDFFKEVDGKLLFIGDTLEAYVPQKYDDIGYLTLGDIVKTIGYFTLIINGTIISSMRLPSVIDTVPSTVAKATRNGSSFIKLSYVKNDVFINDLRYVEDSRIIEILFGHMAMRGNFPEDVTYAELGFIWKTIGSETGTHFSTCQSIFEVVGAVQSRDPKDGGVQWRHTSMKGTPNFIGLANVSTMATSISGLLNGAYAKNGLYTAMADTETREDNLVEEILRK